MLKQVTIYTIRILFMILFTYAAISKLQDYSHFKFQLGRSPFIQHIAPFVAIALPIGELLIAVLLITQKWYRIGIYLSFFTMLLFTGYIYAMLNYSYFLPCSCGGILNNMDWHTHFIFNIIVTTIALLGIFIKEKDGETQSHNKQLVTPV